METITEADLKELQNLITKSNQNFETKLNDFNKQFDELGKQFKEFDKKIIEITACIKATNATIEVVEKRMLEGVVNTEKPKVKTNSILDKPIIQKTFNDPTLFMAISIAISTTLLIILDI